MALERTWVAQAIDQTPANQTTQLLLRKSLLFAFKQFITGVTPAEPLGAWTVDRSSDGVSASAGDLWGSSFDASKILWNSNGAARSWIVFKSPVGFAKGGNFLYLCLDLRQDSGGQDANSHFLRWAISGYPFTGGSATARPTAISETQFAQDANRPWIRQGSDGEAYEWHGRRSTVGDFAFFISRNGTGVAMTSWLGFTHADYKAADLFPCSISRTFDENYAPDINGLSGQGDGGRGTVGVVWINGDGVDTRKDAVVRPVCPTNFNANAVIGSNIGFDSIDGEPYTRAAEVWQIDDAGALNRGYRGRWVDLLLNDNLTPQLEGQPSSGPPYDRVKVGSFLVPFTAKPSF